ncbi:MAG: hypothetical protein EVG15_01000 [Candidatus Acididesulfobacter diazotrophicus]|uniref:Uncharacterized protein n=1 Tax=Candidatus Acididesulfobacter diazotrophicus TaxID=2597226 RepID=A0A519BQD3_9DELT|nr:MAG: hypothetical protein EVG15_01000 [Candidatus Acididesulfobacter diazotrophicus]
MDNKNNKVWKIDTLSFSGLLKWEQIDLLVEKVKNSNEKWYYNYTQIDNPTTEMTAEEAGNFLNERSSEIKELDKICGWFYVYTMDNPEIIKIYHPRMSGGSSCSIITPPPWIIVSIEKPEEIANIESYKPVIKKSKKGIFRYFS